MRGAIAWCSRCARWARLALLAFVAARRALAHLPAGTVLRATLPPVVEPRDDGVETFAPDILDGRLTIPDSVRAAGMSFFGVQVPRCTLGWVMASRGRRRCCGSRAARG